MVMQKSAGKGDIAPPIKGFNQMAAHKGERVGGAPALALSNFNTQKNLRKKNHIL